MLVAMMVDFNGADKDGNVSGLMTNCDGCVKEVGQKVTLMDHEGDYVESAVVAINWKKTTVTCKPDWSTWVDG